MIQAVIFDVDGVMVDSFDANHQFFVNLFTKFGYKPPTHEEYRELFPMPMMQVIRKIASDASEDEIMEIFNAGKNRKILYPYDLLKSPEYLQKTIESLARKYDLGIVTSRIAGGVFSLPQLTPLEKHFKAAVYYEDTEKHKPSPEPLLLAIERLAVDPSEGVYIGDAQSDLDAASAAGTHAIYYNTSNALDAENWVDNFESIPSMIKKIA